MQTNPTSLNQDDRRSWGCFLDYRGGARTRSDHCGYSVLGDGIKKSESIVASYVLKSAAGGLQGQTIGLSRIWLMVDVDRTN